MATKASLTLVLIIEKQHASWGLMVTALLAWNFTFGSSSVSPPHGQFRVVGPMRQSGAVHVCMKRWPMACHWLAYHPVDC